jgi:superfamily II DNA helicase RecQ
MIKDSEDADEDEKQRQLDQLDEVVKFCMNKDDCRRTLLLRYFGQPDFDPRDCHQFCDTCGENTDKVAEDMTGAALDVLHLVGSAASHEHFGKGHWTDVFRGSKAKKVLQHGHDKLQWHGRGKELDREKADRLIEELLVLKALESYEVHNASGWSATYMKVRAFSLRFPGSNLTQLGPAANEFLLAGRKLIMRFREKPAKKVGAMPMARSVKKPRKNTAQEGFASAATISTRPAGTREHYEPIDFFDEDDEVFHAEDIDEDTVSPPQLKAQSSRGRPEMLSNGPGEHAKLTNDQCYRELRAIRSKVVCVLRPVLAVASLALLVACEGE